MRHDPIRPAALTGCIVTVLVLLQSSPPSLARPRGAKQALEFATDMAVRGNWREASYRWKLVAEKEPDDPRIFNNLGVASEALGDSDGARDYYDKAVALSGADARIEDNRRRFLRALEEREAREQGENAGDAKEGEAAGVRPGERAKPKGSGHAIRVTVELPSPPRLDLESGISVLVASFRAPDSSLLDVNRELVRFLRSEFRKKSDLRVLDVVPPPAIPEQTIEDLLANREFWQHLSREYDAELIVSGVANYGREDASGFEDVDRISSLTGQKVRRTEFVERERFDYGLDIFFIDGPTGTLMFRDRLKRSVVFRGQMNDPITAFYELSESIASDVLAVVSPRKRVEPRWIFRK